MRKREKKRRMVSIAKPGGKIIGWRRGWNKTKITRFQSFLRASTKCRKRRNSRSTKKFAQFKNLRVINPAFKCFVTFVSIMHLPWLNAVARRETINISEQGLLCSLQLLYYSEVWEFIGHMLKSFHGIIHQQIPWKVFLPILRLKATFRKLLTLLSKGYIGNICLIIIILLKKNILWKCQVSAQGSDLWGCWRILSRWWTKF